MDPVAKPSLQDFSHTPFADGSKPFRIGLVPLDPEKWIETDAALEAYLTEKSRLYEACPADVFCAEPGSEAAQQEVLDLLSDHLLRKHPEIYVRTEQGIEIGGTGRTVVTDDCDQAPLWIAAQLVQEDLVLMRKGEGGWRLVAGSVSFPSSWRLAEKFSKPMVAIHRPVPGFGEGTRNAMMIERIFDNLLVDQPVERFNWSIYSDNILHHPDRSSEHTGGTSAHDILASYLRVERQTLRKLPLSGDILFTIRIHLDPLELIRRHADRDKLVDGFVDSLRSMTDDELQYKNLLNARDDLIAALEAVR